MCLGLIRAVQIFLSCFVVAVTQENLMAKISVIIPTYNRACYLKAAITSVLSQTFTDLELIIIDDASQDDTSRVVKDFKGLLLSKEQEA